MDLFSAGGIASWQQRVNSSPAFAEAARSWTGRLLLVETVAEGVPRSAWVVVQDGRCSEARTGALADEQAADYVLAASPATWTDLVSATQTPASAALGGHLRLLKGSLIGLIPHARAAAELLAAAADEVP